MAYGTQCIRCRRNIAAGRSLCIGCRSFYENLEPTTELEERNDRRRAWRTYPSPAYERAVARRAWAQHEVRIDSI